MPGNLSAFTSLGVFGYPIPERSEATPGLFNQIFSGLSANLDRLNSDVSSIVGSSVGTTESVLGFSSNTLRAESGNTVTLQPYAAAFLAKSIDSGGQVYNVRAFGAVGNGTTDDLSAVTLAIAAAQLAGGGIVYFPQGTYGFSSTLTPSATTRVILMGAGRRATTLQHLTGGRVLGWIQNHLNTEFYSGLKDMRISGNTTGGFDSIVRLEGMTLFSLEHVAIENNNSIVSAVGAKFISLFDSEIHDLYVTDCGSPTSPCMVLDSYNSTNQPLNNCHFYNVHIEPGVVNASLLSMVGNNTSNVKNNRFYGLKTHGDPSTGTPPRPLVLISQYCTDNHFDHHLIAFGSGIAQVVCDGNRNTWVAPVADVLVGTAPVHSFQFTANGSNNNLWGPNFPHATSYGTSCFRTEAGAIHNRMLCPEVSGAAAGNLYSDAGRSVVFWDDAQSQSGFALYASDALRFPTTGLRGQDGTTGYAAYAFDNENALGWYRSGASAMGLSYGQLQLPAGTAVQPADAYSSESSLGWYRSATSTIALSYGTFDLSTAVTSIGSLKVKAGANQSCGTAVLGSNGSVNVANTYVKTGDLIFLTDQSPGGTLGDLEVGGIRNSSGFTIQSTSVTDTSTVAWLIVRPG